MVDKASLPKAVSAVADRLSLNFAVDRKRATRQYVENYQDASRLSYDQLRFSFYSLDESSTAKKNDGEDDAKKKKKKKLSEEARNPLKLNSRIRKALYQIDSEEKRNMRYTTFEQVHQLWLGYAGQVLADTRGGSDRLAAFRMDLHGCKLTCSASRNPSLVGSGGIVVQETRNTFLVITERNRLLTLPKRESIFEFKVGESLYRIHGCNLLFTSQTRAKVKYKQKKSMVGI